jgi:hypothetical protein
MTLRPSRATQPTVPDGADVETGMRKMCGAVAAVQRPRAHLQLRVHVLRDVRQRDAGPLPELRRRTCRAAAARNG